MIKVTDPAVSQQWHITKMGMQKAWDITMGKASVKVAVIDSGVDATHPELKDRVSYTYDVVRKSTKIRYPDDHGTHVAGIIAASANNRQGVGVAPKVTLLCYDVFSGDALCYTSNLIKAINYATDKGCRVINMSLGSYDKDELLEQALKRARSKNVTVVAAGGNGDRAGNPITKPSYPADYSTCISVVPVNKKFVRPKWADYNKYKDISAPGIDIYSTTPKGKTDLMSGSSMATPFVTGVYALMYSVNPKLTCSEADKIVFNTAKDLGAAGKDKYYGYGLIQPASAVAKAAKQAPLSPPKTVKAATASYNSAKITWSEAPGVAGYVIYRSTSKNGTYTKIKTVAGGSTTSYTDAKLASGKTYYYKVRAYRAKGSGKIYSSYSAAAAVKVAPSQPTGVKVARISPTSAKVTWKKVSGATGYQVYRSTSKDGTYRRVKTIAGKGNISYTDKKLSSGKTYYYKVRAYRTVSKTNVYSGYSTAAATISPPTTIKAGAASYNSVKVTWKKVSGAAGYGVYRSTSKNGTYTKIKTVSGGSTASYTDPKLVTGKTYYYKVRAYHISGKTKVYSGFSAVAGARVAPKKPSSIKVARVSKTSAKVTWTKVAGATGYEVYRSTSKNGTYAKLKTVAGVGTTSYTDKNLSSKKAYYYKVRAYRTVGKTKVYSSYSAIAKGELYANASITLFWFGVENASGYEIYRSTSARGNFTKIMTIPDGSITGFRDEKLVPGKTYYYNVRAYRKKGSKKIYSNYFGVISAVAQ